MKKLSYFAKSNIFLLLSLAVAVSEFWIKFMFQDTLWGILLAVGYYYYGKDRGAREAERKSKTVTVHLYKDSVKVW